MVSRLYSKCSMCRKVTMLKYQVGYGSFPICYVCPNCKTDIQGEAVHAKDGPGISFEMENAELIQRVAAPDYYLQVSREFPTAHIKKYTEKDEFDISPYLKWGDMALNENSRLHRAIQFSDRPLTEIKRMIDLLHLWETNNCELLKEKLKPITKSWAVNRVSSDTKIGQYMRLHQVLVVFATNLLPLGWAREIDLFTLINQTADHNDTEMNELADVFEGSGLLKEYEEKATAIIASFFYLSRRILPAFLLLDSSELREKSADYAISTASFHELEDFYQRSHEYIIEAVDILIALNNIMYRGKYDVLPDAAKCSFVEYHDGNNKMRKFDECLNEEEQFSKFLVKRTDNVVRNSIGHNTTSFDGITQTITFRSKNKDTIKTRQVPLIEFAAMCIENFESCFYILEAVYQLRKRVFGRELPLAKKQEIVLKKKKTGRNDLCPCGSGKKYKKCCWLKEH